MGDFFGLAAADIITFVEQMVNAAIGGLYNIDVAVANADFGGGSVIWGALQNVWSWLGGVFSALWNMVTNIIHWIMHTLLPDLVAWINEIRAKITAWLQPLIQMIKLEIQWLDQVYNNVIKPMLNLIQRIRSFLVIFRLMGLGWANTLDQWLADLENRISAAFLQARQDIGVLANWINYVIDPTGLFNIPLFLLTQFQTLPQLWAALIDGMTAEVGAVTAQTQATAASSGLFSNAYATLQAQSGGPTQDNLTRYSAVSQLYQSDGYAG
jgi:hypothetical protein